MHKNLRDFRVWLCLVVSVFSVFNSAATSALSGGNCVSINGMYVSLRAEGNNSLLGNYQQETDLLTFAQKNGFNYLILYDLEGMVASSARATYLASFISRARKQYGIQQIGAALGASASGDAIVAYNTLHMPNERIDVLNLEYEFWNRSERSVAFATTLDILAHFKHLAANNSLLTEIYIGWINEQEGLALSSAVDRILVHYYRQNDTDLVNYGLERLQYLAAGDHVVKIAPIFSNEGPSNTGDPTGFFMGPWLATHAIDQAYKSWYSQYQQVSADWKQNIEVIGATWFLYNYFADIDSVDVDPITSQPQDQSLCIGDALSLQLTSSESNTDIGWFKDGQCLTNNADLQGASSSNLMIDALSSNDFADYQARVISYDASNPSSHVSRSATITLGQNCTAPQTNIALYNTVTASSFIAAGYEPDRVVDQNSSSRWASQYSGDQWIQVDLGDVFQLSTIRLLWDAAYAVDYQISSSLDGQSWQVVLSLSGNEQLLNEHSNLSVNARYVRLNGTAKALPQWGFSLNEFEVYGSPANSLTCNN